MPTQADYEWLARRYDVRATELEVLPREFVAALSPDVLSGPHARVVDSAFQVSLRHLGTAARMLRDTATECRRRAEICRRYTGAVDSYRYRLAHPDLYSPPPRPGRPYSWTEYGR